MIVCALAQCAVTQAWVWCDNYDDEPWHADSGCPWMARQGWFWQCTAYGKPACCQETKNSGSPYDMCEHENCACDAMSRSCCDGNARGRALRGDPDNTLHGEEIIRAGITVDGVTDGGEMIAPDNSDLNTAEADNTTVLFSNIAHGEDIKAADKTAEADDDTATIEEETALLASGRSIDEFARVLSSASKDCADPETVSCKDRVPSNWCRWFWLKCSDDCFYTWECKGWLCGGCYNAWHRKTMCKNSRSMYCNGGGNHECRP